MSNLPSFPRADLERWARQPLRPPSLVKPGVWLVESPLGPVVVKDARCGHRRFLWLSRYLLARERRVLRHMAGSDRVPRIVAEVDRDAIVLEFLEGLPLDRETFRQRPRELIAQILEVTDGIHARGVFHLDLHQRKNLLVGADGRLRLVDFGASLTPGPLIRAFVGPLLRVIDRQAALKYLARFAPEVLTEAEARTVLLQRRLRKLWFFTSTGRSESEGARRRLGRVPVR